MATHICETPARSGAGRRSPFSFCWLGACAIASFFAGLALALFRIAKRRRAPVIHEGVTLTPEGAQVVTKAMDPKCPVGKPVNHRPSRVKDGDAVK